MQLYIGLEKKTLSQLFIGMQPNHLVLCNNVTTHNALVRGIQKISEFSFSYYEWRRNHSIIHVFTPFLILYRAVMSVKGISQEFLQICQGILSVSRHLLSTQQHFSIFITTCGRLDERTLQDQPEVYSLRVQMDGSQAFSRELYVCLRPANL